MIAGGAIGLVALLGIGGFAATRGEDSPPTTNVAPSTTVAVTETTEFSTTAIPTTETAGAPTVARLAQSTVQVLVLDSAGNPTCQGSGTILDNDGTILTNAHVITPGNGCEVEQIAIAITDDAGLPPLISYYADLIVFDFELDLAVLRIAETIDGSPLPTTYPITEIGDSDNVTIGDDIRILGYPSIGGDTITFTNGSVSGFTSQAGIDARSWIKTDATIAGGNSGGTAVDDDGRLIGIPTQAAASETGPIADCRVVTDTNGDGITDGNDQCIPIGGFLNGIRPVNLALPILAEAEGAAPLAPNAAGLVTFGNSNVSVDDVTFYLPSFSLGVGETIDDTVFTTTAAAGATELCFWFDWLGFPEGTAWDAVWVINGEIIDDFSFFNQTWIDEVDGQNFWVCAQNADGLQAGLYEVVFFIEGEISFVEAIQVTEASGPIFEVQFLNETTTEVCYLHVNPLGSSGYGLDELGATATIEPGASHTLYLPAGTIIAQALDCGFNTVSGSSEGIEIIGDDTITIR